VVIAVLTISMRVGTCCLHVPSYLQKHVLIDLSPKAAEGLVKSLVSIAYYTMLSLYMWDLSGFPFEIQ